MAGPAPTTRDEGGVTGRGGMNDPLTGWPAWWRKFVMWLGFVTVSVTVAVVITKFGFNEDDPVKTSTSSTAIMTSRKTTSSMTTIDMITVSKKH
jgi:hypothetical protein